MRSEYRFFKHEYGISQDVMLNVFEKFCRRSQEIMDGMEWSWKFRGASTQADRVLWLGAGNRREETGRRLQWLAAELAFVPADLPDGLRSWQYLLENYTDRALVAYAGASTGARCGPVLKLYLTLESCPRHIYSEMFRSLSPALPAFVPSGGRLILCHAIYETGRIASRVYLFFPQRAFSDPGVARCLARLGGKRAVAIARKHPSAGFALKSDTTDMLGLSLRPTGLSLKNHPSWWTSPALDPLLYMAGRTPALRERLSRVSWITVPLTPAALEFPLEMPEMNVYVKLT